MHAFAVRHEHLQHCVQHAPLQFKRQPFERLVRVTIRADGPPLVRLVHGECGRNHHLRIDELVDGCEARAAEAERLHDAFSAHAPAEDAVLRPAGVVRGAKCPLNGLLRRRGFRRPLAERQELEPTKLANTRPFRPPQRLPLRAEQVLHLSAQPLVLSRPPGATQLPVRDYRLPDWGKGGHHPFPQSRR